MSEISCSECLSFTPAQMHRAAWMMNSTCRTASTKVDSHRGPQAPAAQSMHAVVADLQLPTDMTWSVWLSAPTRICLWSPLTWHVTIHSGQWRTVVYSTWADETPCYNRHLRSICKLKFILMRASFATDYTGSFGPFRKARVLLGSIPTFTCR